MPKVQLNGLTTNYQIDGEEGTKGTIVLVNGLADDLTSWGFQVPALVAAGYKVLSFDNRGIGQSDRPAGPYSSRQLADDAKALVDHLGLRDFHMMGVSMGGMIAQLVAAHWPARTLSLTSIMSTTGNPALPGASLQAMGILLRRPRSDDPEAIVAHGVKASKIVAGRFPEDDALMAGRYREEVLRNHHPSGFVRQMAAILADGDRRERLRTIAAPSVVVHGMDDPLVPIAGGRDTAANIPGARLAEIPGMGHTLPPQVIPAVVEAFESVARPVKLARAA